MKSFHIIPYGIHDQTYGFHVEKYGFHVKKYGFHVEKVWIPCGKSMDSMWKKYGFHMEKVWIPYGKSMDSMWKSMESIRQKYGIHQPKVWNPSTKSMESINHSMESISQKYGIHPPFHGIHQPLLESTPHSIHSMWNNLGKVKYWGRRIIHFLVVSCRPLDTDICPSGQAGVISPKLLPCCHEHFEGGNGAW